MTPCSGHINTNSCTAAVY